MKNIVFVLGAGASKPFDFLLGSELIIKIIEGIKEGNYKHIHETFSNYRNRNQSPIHYDFFQNPYQNFYSAIKYSRNVELVKKYNEKCNNSSSSSNPLWLPAYHTAFAEMLNSKTSSSIDYVLNENPSYDFIGRAYITLEILRVCMSSQKARLAESELIRPDYERYTKLAPKYSENWYILLAEFIKKLGKNTCASLNVLYDESPVQFVTFNYDMSLEHYFNRFFDSEIYKDFDVNRIVSNISHVYGKVDICANDNQQDSDIDTNMLRLIFSQAENISLIRGNSAKTNKIREDIRQHIKKADVICVLGFAFDEENLKVIGLDKAMTDSSKKIYVLNFDKNQRISRLTGSLKNIFVTTGSIKNAFQSEFISPDICMDEPSIEPSSYR